MFSFVAVHVVLPAQGSGGEYGVCVEGGQEEELGDMGGVVVPASAVRGYVCCEVA